ncbi:ABC-F family ATP-binding cassette domain-containing protein [Cytophagaceae bacterium ABcell3]|nr:ABC-F family ATP-binding cassette domain-containing protein [Cytophagaceae bacterium ABcell3]
MNYISADAISKSFADKPLFQNITLGISKGEKVALTGRNGSGKSTLLKILSGKIPPDSGQVVIRKDIRTAHLDQNPDFGNAVTVSDAIYSGNTEVADTIKEYEACLQNPSESDKLQHIMEKMDALNAWDYERKTSEVLSKLGITDILQPVETLSGGQKKRVALAKVLLQEPDLLIMDEPTNHLDLDSIEWLEQLLSASATTLLLVTHDRYFLDKVCNEIIELDQDLYKYKGNYSYFLEKKAERIANEQSVADKAANLLKKELDWMRRQPKARGTKAKYRVDAFYDLQDKARPVQEEDNLQLDMKVTRLGNKVLELENISKSFGDKKVADNFSYTFPRKARVGIVGKNGTGKSTFLNMITGQVQPDSGKITTGETIIYGYYTQEITELKEDLRVIENVTEVAEVITMNNGSTLSASALLTRFLFPPEKQYTPVYKLSGGEKKRLMLMRILMKNPNFLILDEPTNDLDLNSLNVLEDFLESYGGCLLIVSHDRYFMDRLVNELFIFEGDGKIRSFPGNYTDYRLWLDQQQQQEKKEEKAQVQVEKQVPSKTKSSSDKLTFKEKKEYETLEKDIELLEEKKEQLVNKMNSGTLSHEDLTATSEEVEKLIKDLEKKTDRWLELSERA